MADRYVYSGAGGAGTGADWANAYTTLAAAFTGGAAGDRFFLAHDHAESQASAMTLTNPGTSANLCPALCVNRSGSVPPVSADLRTTATVTTTGNNAMTINGVGYYYGITFNAGSGAVSANLVVGSNAVSDNGSTFKNCSLRKLGTTNTLAAISMGSTTTGRRLKVVLDNTTLHFGHASDACTRNNCWLEWRDTASAVGGTVPNNLFRNESTSNVIVLRGVDLSAVSGNVFGSSGFLPGLYRAINCKLHASGGFVTPGALQAAPIEIINCDSGATNYRTERILYEGTQTVETTIVRTGGATDRTTPIAWKIVTTADSKLALPFTSLPIAVWNNVTGSSITVDIEGIWGGGAVPDNDDIWIEVEYLGDAGSPLGSTATSGKADFLASATNYSAGSGTWGGSTTKFKMSATFTPQQKGAITIYVKAALASSTFYIDPRPVINNVAVQRSHILGGGTYINERASDAVRVNSNALVAA